MMKRINDEREEAGVGSVVLSGNGVAQRHAQAMWEGCFLSHWGLDGLKPYMRYSAAGGYFANGENISGLGYCITEADGYAPIGSLPDEIDDVMDGFMNSPGHRKTILDPRYTGVDIGLVWGPYGMTTVQHFTGALALFLEPPSLSDGVLRLDGNVGLDYSLDRDSLRVQVYYDPPPTPLTRGQVSRTSCYGYGAPVAALRPPLGLSRRYTADTYTATRSPCPNPYDAPPDAPAATSHDEAHELWRQAREMAASQPDETFTVSWITASTWDTNGNYFTIEADIGGVLDAYGPGVYTIVLWGPVDDGERGIVSEYAIFFGVEVG